MLESEALAALADRYGVYPDYWDINGNQHRCTSEVQCALLAAMGVPCADTEQIEASMREAEERLWRSTVPPVVVLSADSEGQSVPVLLSGDLFEGFAWRLTYESGEEVRGSLQRETAHVLESRGELLRVRLDLPHALPQGYHQLMLATLSQPEFEREQSQIVATPARCYLPEKLMKGERLWGLSAQLYSLRSETNWGVGDFRDLRSVLSFAVSRGADFVGLNPLHAVAPRGAPEISPYNPCSREQFNGLYLDIERAAEYLDAEKTSAFISRTEFQNRLASLRSTHLVAYQDVADVKFEALEFLYQEFQSKHARAKTEQGGAYHAFLQREGERLRSYAIYSALQETFRKEDPAVWGWPVWPEAYRSPESPAVYQFYIEHLERVGFYQFVSWLADAQLEEVKTQASSLNMQIGLYLDLALGASRGSAEVWAAQSLFALDASAGAPPDKLGPQGQNWGLPPVLPHRAQESGYELCISVFRCVMRHAGAVRIDHVMNLLRLYWVPESLPGQGAYVRYPLHEIIGILALESQRARCLVIGEDLGTVPDEVRAAMHERGVLSYKVLYFEKEGQHAFRPAEHYPRDALVVTSTHDLATLRGYFEGADLQARAKLSLHEPQVQTELEEERLGDRKGLLEQLVYRGLLPEEILQALEEEFPQMPDEFAKAVHLFLAAAPSMLQAIQLEDLTLDRYQANLPGTVREHPNWQRKLPSSLEELFESPRVDELLCELAEVRRHPV